MRSRGTFILDVINNINRSMKIPIFLKQNIKRNGLWYVFCTIVRVLDSTLFSKDSTWLMTGTYLSSFGEQVQLPIGQLSSKNLDL